MYDVFGGGVTNLVSAVETVLGSLAMKLEVADVLGSPRTF